MEIHYKYEQRSEKGDGSIHCQTESESPTPQSTGIPGMFQRRPIKTALHQAVIDCRLHQVRLLVSKHGVNVDCRDLNGRTPMMLACIIEEEFGYKMAKIFMKAGAFLNLRDNLGRTALSYACMNGREEIVRMILREDVLDINEADNDGNTPLHHAGSSGNQKIVTLLVDCFMRFGLDVDTRNKLGYTALLLACKNGHFVSAHILLSKGAASPSLRDNEIFLNASEWTQRGHGFQRKAIPRRIVPNSVSPLAFSRESTMYQQNHSSTCKHVKSQQEMAAWSANGLRLPALYSQNHTDIERSETIIDGKDARQVVLNEIDDYETQNRPRSLKKYSSRFNVPSTAKLLAVNKRSKTTIIPDMTTIFKIYSDQYQPDWRHRSMSIKNSEVFSACSSHSTSMPGIEVPTS